MKNKSFKDSEIQCFKALFAKYCKTESALNHCIAVTCESCPVNIAYNEIFDCLDSSPLNEDELRELYFSTKSSCCKCGCSLYDLTDTGLGNIFVLDKEGNFYCSDCDKEFEDFDDRIFVP